MSKKFNLVATICGQYIARPRNRLNTNCCKYQEINNNPNIVKIIDSKKAVTDN